MPACGNYRKHLSDGHPIHGICEVDTDFCFECGHKKAEHNKMPEPVQTSQENLDKMSRLMLSKDISPRLFELTKYKTNENDRIEHVKAVLEAGLPPDPRLAPYEQTHTRLTHHLTYLQAQELEHKEIIKDMRKNNHGDIFDRAYHAGYSNGFKTAATHLKEVLKRLEDSLERIALSNPGPLLALVFMVFLCSCERVVPLGPVKIVGNQDSCWVKGIYIDSTGHHVRYERGLCNTEGHKVRLNIPGF